MRDVENPNFGLKLIWSLPWLMRYPKWRTYEILRRVTERVEQHDLILVIANHFEPGWDPDGRPVEWASQVSRVQNWRVKARRIGDAIRDSNNRPFCHTYFYPGEQYHRPILEELAELQREGLGEVEVHLHHGSEHPDTATNLRRMLEEFRDTLAEEHQLLSRVNGAGRVMYAFVHGDLALANSAGGRSCGVESEMQILIDTGCYADFTLPSAPDKSQVPSINTIYQCGRTAYERVPHRTGENLRVGGKVTLPILLTGPLVFDWKRRIHGVPVPRIDEGSLAANYPLNFARFNRWRGANIGVRGCPEWVFIKLGCHGFFPQDQEETIGAPMQRFLETILEFGEKSGQYRLHFVTAREAFNIVMAAVDGHKGDPGLFRDYLMYRVMKRNESFSNVA